MTYEEYNNLREKLEVDIEEWSHRQSEALATLVYTETDSKEEKAAVKDLRYTTDKLKALEDGLDRIEGAFRRDEILHYEEQLGSVMTELNKINRMIASGTLILRDSYLQLREDYTNQSARLKLHITNLKAEMK